MEYCVFTTALVVYCVSTAVFAVSMLVKRVALAKLAVAALGFAVLVHTVFILWHWAGSGISPVVNIYEALSFVAWAVSGSYLVFQAITKTRVLGAFVSPPVLLLMIIASAGIAGPGEIDRSLETYWVTVHVIFTLTGTAFFALACCAALMYLVQDRLIRKRKISDFSRLLPSLGDLDKISHVSVVWGFLLLTVGIVSGSLWARTAWGDHLLWDAKQVATLAAWVLCALLLHQRLAIGWKGKRAAYLSIGAFIILLFSFVGVNMFFPTVHRF